MFMHNIVQGRLNDEGNYGAFYVSVCVGASHASRYRRQSIEAHSARFCLHPPFPSQIIRTEVKLRPEQHLQGKAHEEVTHVDDRLVNKTVVVERTKGSSSGSKRKEGEGGGGGCCGGGSGGTKH